MTATPNPYALQRTAPAVTLGDFTALPGKAHPARDTRPLRNAWFEVRQKLRTSLEEVGDELREAQRS